MLQRNSKPRFGSIGVETAAAANSTGLPGSKKDTLVWLDPVKEVLYLPKENIRNEEALESNIDALLAMRTTLDREGQLQAIRVYPLPPELLDSNNKDLKYAVAYGHRRLLSCRLTSADSALIGGATRKIMALVDNDWLAKSESERVRCQLTENIVRVDLNFVEEGEALRRYREALGREENRPVPQRELCEIFGVAEKTLGQLLQAAEFDELAKKACNLKVMTDLDSLVSFDLICKINPAFGLAIYTSLEDESAPRNRTLIRAAKTFIETTPDYKLDENWAWPETVTVMTAKKVDAAVQKPLARPATPQGAVENTASTSSNSDSNANTKNSSTADDSGAKTDQVSSSSVPAGDGLVALEFPGAGAKPPASPVVKSGGVPKTPLLLVSFKMGDEASNLFNGELRLDVPAKNPSLASVSYLDTGRETIVEVPLRFITLISISHT